MDSYGDGLTGDPGCSPDGSLQINLGNDSLTGFSQAEANFGSQIQLSFCVDQNSISENEWGSIHLFPNPAKDFFVLTWSQKQLVEIEVISLFGQILLNENIDKKKTRK